MNLANNRLGRTPVKLIGINAPFEPTLQFGRAYEASDDVERRNNAHNAWGGSSHSGRNGAGTDNGAIKQPLSARQQSILSHQLSPQLQSQLRGGIKPPNNQGRGMNHGPVDIDSVHLGSALGHRSRGQHSVAAVPLTRGGFGVRRVAGEF